MTPKVTFVTVCFRTPGLVRQLLSGVEAAALPFPFEYILVDNAAGDGTGAMVREEFPWVKIIDKQGNVGFGAGNNLAFREATGDYVMLVNPDLTFFKGEMEKLLAFADANSDIGFIGPKLLNPDRTLQHSFHRFPSPFIPIYRRTRLGRTARGKKAVESYLMQDADPNVVQDVDGLFGAAILIRRAALNAVGEFDEKFFMYFEDVDLCRRAWEKGWRVTYAPIAEFVHYHQRESEVKHIWDLVMKRVPREHIKSAIHYFRKYSGKTHPRVKAS
ncbi:MAG: glycosyltransferase family 2 protein [Patescibacteria group bacterium]